MCCCLIDYFFLSSAHFGAKRVWCSKNSRQPERNWVRKSRAWGQSLERWVYLVSCIDKASGPCHHGKKVNQAQVTPFAHRVGRDVLDSWLLCCEQCEKTKWKMCLPYFHFFRAWILCWTLQLKCLSLEDFKFIGAIKFHVSSVCLWLLSMDIFLRQPGSFCDSVQFYVQAILNGIDSVQKVLQTFRDSGKYPELTNGYYGVMIENMDCDKTFYTCVEVTAGNR